MVSVQLYEQKKDKEFPSVTIPSTTDEIDTLNNVLSYSIADLKIKYKEVIYRYD